VVSSFAAAAGASSAVATAGGLRLPHLLLPENSIRREEKEKGKKE
jgi:hypothetical protein